MKNIILLFIFFLSIFYINSDIYANTGYLLKDNFSASFSLQRFNFFTGVSMLEKGYFLNINCNTNDPLFSSLKIYSHTGNLLNVFGDTTSYNNGGCIYRDFQLFENDKYIFYFFFTKRIHSAGIGLSNIFIYDKYTGKYNYQTNIVYNAFFVSGGNPYIYGTDGKVYSFHDNCLEYGNQGDLSNVCINRDMKFYDYSFAPIGKNCIQYNQDFCFKYELIYNSGSTFPLSINNSQLIPISFNKKYYIFDNKAYTFNLSNGYNSKLSSYQFTEFNSTLQSINSLLDLPFDTTGFNLLNIIGLKTSNNNGLKKVDKLYGNLVNTDNSDTYGIEIDFTQNPIFIQGYHNKYFYSYQNKYGLSLSDYGTGSNQYNYKFSPFGPVLLRNYDYSNNQVYKNYNLVGINNLYTDNLGSPGSTNDIVFSSDGGDFTGTGINTNTNSNNNNNNNNSGSNYDYIPNSLSGVSESTTYTYDNSGNLINSTTTTTNTDNSWLSSIGKFFSNLGNSILNGLSSLGDIILNGFDSLSDSITGLFGTGQVDTSGIDYSNELSQLNETGTLTRIGQGTGGLVYSGNSNYTTYTNINGDTYTITNIDLNSTNEITLEKAFTSCPSGLRNVDIGFFSFVEWGFSFDIPFSGYTVDFYPFSGFTCPLKSVVNSYNYFIGRAFQ